MESPSRDSKRSNIAVPSGADRAKDTIAVALGNPSGVPESVPRVLATGRGEFAETILDIAFRNGIKVREDTDLAEILATVDLDSEIPIEAFVAVAEILRYVYASTSDDASEYLEQLARESVSPLPEEGDHGPEGRDT
ncbi:MAG: flagellar protein FhlB [Alphaproteobacteria bacterium]|nr:flagellar protein FhlB [Alphaproteobacteria bacterium]